MKKKNLKLNDTVEIATFKREYRVTKLTDCTATLVNETRFTGGSVRRHTLVLDRVSFEAQLERENADD